MLSGNTISTILFATAALIFINVFVFGDESAPSVSTKTQSPALQEIGDKNTGQVINVVQNNVEDITSGNNTEKSQTETIPVFTVDTLAIYNGEDPSLPIYVAFKGNVYDVTEGKKFYGPDGHYHFLAGTDGTKLLKIFGGDTIQNKYPAVGTFSP